MIYEKSFGAIVYRENQHQLEFVIIKQKHGLHYGFPKGHKENLETDELAAVREVKEETGIEIELKDKFKEVTQYSPKKDVIKEVVYFLGKALTFCFTPQEEEISEVSWVKEKDVLSYLTYRNDHELFLKAIDRLRSGKKGSK